MHMCLPLPTVRLFLFYLSVKSTSQPPLWREQKLLTRFLSTFHTDPVRKGEKDAKAMKLQCVLWRKEGGLGGWDHCIGDPQMLVLFPVPAGTLSPEGRSVIQDIWRTLITTPKCYQCWPTALSSSSSWVRRFRTVNCVDFWWILATSRTQAWAVSWEQAMGIFSTASYTMAVLYTANLCCSNYWVLLSLRLQSQHLRGIHLSLISIKA